MKKVVKKTRTNRKLRFNSPNHIKSRFISSLLSPPLKSQYGVRSMRVRNDDNVIVIKGDRKLTEAKVIKINPKKHRIYLEGVTRTRMDGSTVQIPIRPENVMITRLSLDDEKRRNILERRGFQI